MTRSLAEFVVASALLVGSGVSGWIVRDAGLGHTPASTMSLAATVTSGDASDHAGIVGLCWNTFGTPSSEGTICLSHNGQKIATTSVDRNGRFALSDLEPGNYEISVEMKQTYPNHRVSEFGMRKVRVERGQTADGSVRATWRTVSPVQSE